MKPIINLDDPVGKVVGRRGIADPLQVDPRETVANEQWRAAGLGIRCRRGVYRFQSYDEADQWMMDHMVRKAGN